MEGAKNLILPVLFLGAESEKRREGGKGKLCLGGKTNKRERREEFGIGAAEGGVSSTRINAQCSIKH